VLGDHCQLVRPFQEEVAYRVFIERLQVYRPGKGRKVFNGIFVPSNGPRVKPLKCWASSQNWLVRSRMFIKQKILPSIAVSFYAGHIPTPFGEQVVRRVFWPLFKKQSGTNFALL